jgi:phosphohistidine phosphatase
MKILLVRHAPAGDKAAFAKSGRPDSARELTAKGRRKMRLGARGLSKILPSLDLILTSPLARAAQTARLLSRAYGKVELRELAELAPTTSPKAVLARLGEFAQTPALALVGHEPQLSALVDLMASRRGELNIELRKGAACLVEFPAAPRAGAGRLLWALAPAHLRRLGR